MSAEIEPNKDEEIKEPKKPIYKRLLVHWQLGFKLFELILSAICIGFIYDPVRVTGLGKSNLHHVGVMYTAYCGFILINCVLIVAKAMRDQIPFRTSALFSMMGCVMFIVTGILLVSDRADLTKHYFFHPETYLLTMLTISTIFAFVTSIVYLVDAIITFKRKEDF